MNKLICTQFNLYDATKLAVDLQDIPRIRDAGYEGIRQDLPWSAIENPAGRYDLRTSDMLATALQKEKMMMLPILCYGNPKVYKRTENTDHDAPITPFQREQFLNYSRLLVTRYKGLGYYWEPWNEPDHPQFWLPEPNIELYFQLLQEFTTMVYNCARGEAVIAPALSTTPGTDGAINMKWLHKLAEYPLIVGKLKGISVHAHRHSAPETIIPELQAVKALFPKKKIIVSEWGYPLVWLANSALLTSFLDIEGAPKKQADYLRRSFAAAEKGGADMMAYYGYSVRNDTEGWSIKGTMAEKALVV